MSKFKAIMKSPHIQIALVTGICIILMAYFSKRVFSQPIGYLASTFPPFLMMIYESLQQRFKEHRILTTWYWILAIFLSTVFVIILYWN